MTVSDFRSYLAGGGGVQEVPRLLMTSGTTGYKTGQRLHRAPRGGESADPLLYVTRFVDVTT